jgi:uncharacterized membrane protein YbhN (UPF0104 family)
MQPNETLPADSRFSDSEATEERVAEEIVEAGPPGRGRDVIGLAISVLVIAAIAWWASRQPAPKFPSDAGHLALLGLACALDVLVKCFVCGWRWHRILVLSGVDHKRRDAYTLVPIGYMGNTVLPARGGELLRVLLLGQRTTARRREILGSIIAERLLDLLILIALFAILTWSGVKGAPWGRAPATIGAGLVLAAFLAMLMYRRLRRRGRFGRFAAVVRPVAHASRLLFGPVGATLAAVTACIWALYGFECYLVGESLGLSINPIEALTITVFASFSTLVPAAPGFLGTFDGAVILAARSLDISGGAALSFGLILRFVLFVPITAIGLLLLITRYGGFGVLRGVGALSGHKASRA